MTLALIHGYDSNGYLAKWALVNKYTGIYVLLTYLALAGWLVTNAQNYKKLITLFCVSFIAFFVFSIAMSALLFMVAPAFHTKYTGLFWLAAFPWDAFAGNRNTLVVIAAFCFSILLWYPPQAKLLNTLQKILYFLLPFFFLFNASRTGWIILSILMAFCVLLNWSNSKKNLLPLAFGILSVVLMATNFGTSKSIYSQPYRGQMQFMQQAISYNVQYSGDKKRLIALEDGLELYQNNNPLIGSGLGTYKPFQIDKRGEFIDVIDFTGLWLLVETGVLGVLAFGGFFIACVYTTYKKGFIQKSETSYFYKAVFTFLLCFAAMSLLHEFMYTRFVWFITGLAIAKPYTKQLA